MSERFDPAKAGMVWIEQFRYWSLQRDRDDGPYLDREAAFELTCHEVSSEVWEFQRWDPIGRGRRLLVQKLLSPQDVQTLLRLNKLLPQP